MLGSAVVVFAIGALGGIALASFVLRERLAPWPLSLLHAALGAIGLLIVLYAALTAGISKAALTAFVILIIAALGGFYLASIHLRSKVAPKPVVFVHACVAVIGFLTLLGVVFGALQHPVDNPMRIFGHPVHPMLVHFPITFWTVATVAYGLVACDAGELVVTLAKFSNGAGLLLAMLAMLAGLLELRSIDSSSDAMGVAIWHMMIMATAWVCFLLALLLSVSTGFDQATARLGEAACAGAGFALMAAGGWFGGRLVYEFGIAVQKDADP